jgi:signal peptidase II
MVNKVSRKSFNNILLIVSLFIIILDMATKAIVRYYKPDIKLTSFFSITYIQNTGAAFGILKGMNPLLIILSITFIVGAIYYYNKISLDKKQTNTIYILYGLSIMIGGACGNLIDRLFIGHVTDFINLSYNNAFYPAFNVADSCISIGAMIIVLVIFFDKGRM